jgi:predicted transposase/invertase (TIGR01784 family)
MADKKHIRFDWAIKHMLRDKANFSILEGFLSELLKEDITIESVSESQSNPEYEDDKFNQVDVLVHNSKGEVIIIEVQNAYKIDYLFRILYGVSKATTESINLGGAYHKIRKVISISIVYFELGQGEDYVYRGKNQFIGIHRHDVLQLTSKQKDFFGKETMTELYPEMYLIKVEKFDDETRDALDEWIYFFKNSEIKDTFKAKGMKQARKKLNAMNMAKGQREAYQKYLERLSDDQSVADTIEFESNRKAEKLAKNLAKDLAKDLAKEAEEKAQKAKEETEKAKKQIEKSMENIIRTTPMTDEQIGDVFEVPALFITAVRKKLSESKG